MSKKILLALSFAFLGTIAVIVYWNNPDFLRQANQETNSDSILAVTRYNEDSNSTKHTKLNDWRDNWVMSSGEGGSFSTPDRGDDQFHIIRYGVESSGRYFYALVRNGVRIGCNNHRFGDPHRGTGKYCWYKTFRISEVPTQTFWYPPVSGFNLVSNQRAPEIQNQNGCMFAWGYGLDSRLALVHTSRINCNDGGMVGDPLPGTTKKCYQNANCNPILPPMRECSMQQYTCNVPAMGSPFYYIRYGSEVTNRYTYYYASSKLNSFYCDEDLLGYDPAPGENKKCWYGIPEPVIPFTLEMEWNPIIGGVRRYEATYGFDADIDIQTKWSLEQQFKIGFGFGPFSITSTTTFRMDQSISAAIKVNFQEKFVIECEVPSVIYQFRLKFKTMGDDIAHPLKDNSLNLKYYVCRQSYEAPKCPPTFCEPPFSCDKCSSLWDIIVSTLKPK